MRASLQIAEIFLSLQGEGTRSGLPCAFVRLWGCNLNCAWCDTPQAQAAGQQMRIDDILSAIGSWPVRLVEVTGGEPLTQPAAPELLERLCDAEYEVLLETNGSLDVSQLDRRVVRVIDVKCPSSGESGKMLWSNLDVLRPADEVKFVVADRGDFDYAVEVIMRRGLTGRCHLLMTPVAQALQPAQLAQWILDDVLDVRLGLQLHKIIWPRGEPTNRRPAGA